MRTNPDDLINPLAQALDLTAVAARVADELGLDVTSDPIRQGEREYRFFLSLRVADADAELSPTLLADRFWHWHILHTREYAQDCMSLFGGYLHHRPGAISRETRRRSRQEFRALLPRGPVRLADCDPGGPGLREAAP